MGELQDEHDKSPARIVRTGRSIVFPASLRPDELFDRTGIVVPDNGDYETVGGFIAEQLGRVPTAGEEVEIRDGVLRVERAVGTRIDRLRFRPFDPDDSTVGSTHDRLMQQIARDAARE